MSFCRAQGYLGLVCCVVLSTLAGCCPQEGKEREPAIVPSGEVARPPSASPAAPAPRTWPVRDCDDAAPCRMPNGDPGMRCSAAEACFNPCPAGMGPEKDGTFCAKICKSSSDCAGDPCSPEGICNRWPAPLACEEPDFCLMPDDFGGFRCKSSDPCRSTCKKGLALFGGTHCAKPCKSAADCPGGSCDNGVCGPLCPSEGCPYRWE
jgi:hypothetical protein